MQNAYSMAPLLGLFTLAALGLTVRPAAAQTNYFPVDTTIDYAVNGDAFIGYSTAYTLSSPTVNLVKGGDIGGILEVYNGSTFNMSAGAVDDLLWAFNSSTMNVSGGAVGSYLYAIDKSTVTVSGGTFGQYKGVNFVDATTGPFTLTGSGLSFIPDPTGQTPLGGTDYTLTGLLQNGDSVTGDVVEVASGAAMFTLDNAAAVPESSTASLLGSGMLCLAGLLLKARKHKPFA